MKVSFQYLEYFLKKKSCSLAKIHFPGLKNRDKKLANNKLPSRTRHVSVPDEIVIVKSRL